LNAAHDSLACREREMKREKNTACLELGKVLHHDKDAAIVVGGERAHRLADLGRDAGLALFLGGGGGVGSSRGLGCGVIAGVCGGGGGGAAAVAGGGGAHDGDIGVRGLSTMDDEGNKCDLRDVC
jgi:hypothetical protein